MKRKEMLFIIGALLICSIFLLTGYIVHNKKESSSKPSISLNKNNNFDYKFIKQIDGNDNRLVSPLSMAYLLSMVQSGAKGNTLNELNIVLDNYDLQPMENIDSKISMANSMWINNRYKNHINDTFASALKINYHSEVLHDEFVNADNINKWVSEKTYNMINKLFSSDSVNSLDTVMALVNAIGINFKWDKEFNCNETIVDNFLDKNVYMMNSKEKYIESDYYTGFIKDYEKIDSTQFEFIGLLPKKDIQDVISNLSNDVIKNSITDNETYVQIPRFKYEYDVSNVKNILESLGIKDMFNKEKANFADIAKGIYVSKIVQKTYIDFMESGTKAAAASGATFDTITAPIDQKEVIFNKPFVYLIRKKGSNNIYFMGIVKSPIEYDESKDICEG